MPRELSEAHKRAMQEGRRRAAKARSAGAVTRVEAYRALLRKSAEAKTPAERSVIWHEIAKLELPTDRDYRIARGEEAA